MNTPAANGQLHNRVATERHEVTREARAWRLANRQAAPSVTQLASSFNETEKPGRGNAPAN